MPLHLFSRTWAGTIVLPDGEILKETRHIENVAIDQPIAENLFNAGLFFKNVRFTDNFMETQM